jgi:hypothetical protein
MHDRLMSVPFALAITSSTGMVKSSFLLQNNEITSLEGYLNRHVFSFQ